MFNAKMDVLVQTFILGLCLAAEAFQCPTMDSCVEAPVTKLFGVDSSSVSKDQIVSSHGTSVARMSPDKTNSDC